MLIKDLEQYVDKFVARNEYKQFRISRKNWKWEVWVSDNPPIEHVDLREALIEMLSRLQRPISDNG